MRERLAAMEKELGSMQAKAQGSYQELQTMQIKVRALISCRIIEINLLFSNLSMSSVLWEESGIYNVKEPKPFGIILIHYSRLHVD